LYPDARQCSSLLNLLSKIFVTSIVKAHTAQLASIKFLHRDSILLARNLFRHPRLLAIKIIPGWQKLRHASLSSAPVELSS
jgi:hypothetical protein